MMKTIKETLELALEVLITINNAIYVNSQQEADAFYKANDAITALRVALASQGEALTSVPDWASEAIEQPAPATELREQEPVAWLVDNGGDSILIRHSQNFPGVFVGSEFNKRPLVFGDTSPPAQRKPLTVEKILHLVDTYVGAPSMAYPFDSSDWINFARAIESAHGIKGDA